MKTEADLAAGNCKPTPFSIMSILSDQRPEQQHGSRSSSPEAGEVSFTFSPSESREENRLQSFLGGPQQSSGDNNLDSSSLLQQLFNRRYPWMPNPYLLQSLASGMTDSIIY